MPNLAHDHDLEFNVDHERPAPASARPGRTSLVQCLASVRAISQDGILVDEGGVTRLVRQATSCLVEPEVGDLVLLSVPTNDAGGYLLAVLERKGNHTKLAVPGDLELAAPRGRVRVSGEAGVELATGKTLELRSDELRVQARVGRLFFEECAAIIRSAFASLTRLTHVGEVLDLLVDRVTQRSKQSIRAIEGTDHTQAENVDIKASNDIHVHSTRTVMQGREIVKLDGGQIHLG